ncbi:MAG: DUF748 domain-containing protein, partial [Burkholderiaceae bacterium]|nr:DUF748 domain-containing protein [Burkholderiaceae bacterium]
MSRLLSADGGWRLWRRRWVRWLAWAVGALLVFWGVAWLAVPPLVKWQGQKIATEKLGRPVRIGAVQFQPWSLALTLRDLTVGGAKPADPPQFAAKRLYANLSLASALRLAPVVQAIQVDDPALRLRHLGGGHYDVDDILARLNSGPKPPPNAKPARFALYNIAVRGGRITFIDDPVQRTHQVRDLKLTLPFISNLPAKEKVRVTPQLAFTVDGSRFDSGAQALPFEASRRANAHVRIQRFDLAPYLVYQPAGLPVHVTAGTLDADLHLAFEDAHKPSLTISGTADLTGVKVNDAVGQQALAFDRLAVSASDVRPLERVVHLASVDLAGPRVLASRDAQGRINWVPVPSAAPRAAASAAKVADKPARKSAADDWHVTVDHVAIAQGDVQWRDARPAPGAAAKSGPATVHIAPFMLEAKNLTWPPSQAATFNGRLALAGMAAADTPTGHGQGAPAARGKFALDKAVPSTAAASAPFVAFDGQAQMLAAKVDVQARGLPLRLAQPYLAAFFKPALTGQADADVDVAWSAPEPGGSGLGADKAHGKNAGQNAGGGAPGLTIEVSKLALNHLALLGNAGQTHAAAPRRDRSHQPELPPGALASVDALTLEGAKVDLPGRSVAVDAIAVQAPRVRIARDKQGRWMFEDWLVKPAASAKPATRHEAPQQDAQAKPWAVRVGHVAVADGGIGWRDQQPASGAVDVALTQLKLDARDFALGGRKPMPLALSAQLTPRRGETGKLSWRGAVGITPVSARGQVDAERLPLQAFEPYVAGMLNIDILRADASFKGKVDYAQQDNGPRLHVAGDARLEQLHTTSHPGSAASDDTAPRAASNPSGGAGTVVSAADASAASAQTARVALAPDTGAANTAAPSGGLGEELPSSKQLRVAGL